MKESVRVKRRSFRQLVPPVDLAGRIERSSRMDRPIRLAALAVRRRIKPGWLRDLLHGVPTGKPLHPPLVTVSLGCWVATAVLDLSHADPRAARAVLTTGIVVAAPSVATGLTDWSVLHQGQQRVGFVHALANLTAFSLYAGSLALRLSGDERRGRLLSFAALGAAGLGGQLGGHLAHRLAAGANHAESVAHLVPLGWHDLCQLKDLPDGRPVAKRLGYIDLFVLRVGEEVIVLADGCSHLAGPLHQGRLISDEGTACVVCPWHGSTFRLSDGTVAHGPATAPQPYFETRVRGDGVLQVRPVQS
ncbi:Rieske (2Fe-2S) protein [Streptosporangium sp. NPDC087985]|uniref:Rieske (2Fe-2S) protein n=1 Tax=Streptosporangium sp. NPDC087985 TaxID=3366196 RepID=UPI00380E30CE